VEKEEREEEREEEEQEEEEQQGHLIATRLAKRCPSAITKELALTKRSV
jgi:hypothetical protein